MENPYIITYTNHFYFEGQRLAFRKMELFNITTDIPMFVEYNILANCWLIKRTQLTKLKAKDLVREEPISVDISNLQWYEQEQLNHVFNLK